LFFVASSRASQLNTAHLQAPPQADNAGPVAFMLSPCHPCSLAQISAEHFSVDGP
jgi:hypothetical protein